MTAPNLKTDEQALKLALVGAIKSSVIGEEVQVRLWGRFSFFFLNSFLLNSSFEVIGEEVQVIGVAPLFFPIL